MEEKDAPLTDEEKEQLKEIFCSDKYPNKNAKIHADNKKVRQDTDGTDIHQCMNCGIEMPVWNLD